MASGFNSVEAGRAYLRLALEDGEFKKKLRRTQHDLQRWASALGRIGTGMGAAGGGILFGFGRFVKGVADIETATKRFQLIFRDMADTIRNELHSLSRETGIPMTTLIQQSSQFGAIFASMREQLSDTQFAGVIRNTMKAMTDLAAVAGISLEEAAERLKSGFTSTGESVDQFGFNLRKANLQAEANRLGMKQSILTMSEQQKQLIKLSIFMRQANTTGVSFVAMVDTINGQLTLMRANIIELIAQAGGFTKMVMVPLLQSMNRLLIMLRPIAKLLSPFIPLVAAFGAALLSFGAVFIGIAAMLGVSAWAIRFWTTMGAQVVAFVAEIPFVIRGVAAMTGGFAAWAKSIQLVGASLLGLIGRIGLIVAAVYWLGYILNDILGPNILGPGGGSEWVRGQPTPGKPVKGSVFGGINQWYPAGYGYDWARPPKPPQTAVEEAVAGFQPSLSAGAFGGNIAQRLGYAPGASQAMTDALGDLQKIANATFDQGSNAVRTVQEAG